MKSMKFLLYFLLCAGVSGASVLREGKIAVDSGILDVKAGPFEDSDVIYTAL